MNHYPDREDVFTTVSLLLCHSQHFWISLKAIFLAKSQYMCIFFRKQKPLVTFRIRDVNTLSITIFNQYRITIDYALNLKPYLALTGNPCYDSNQLCIDNKYFASWTHMEKPKLKMPQGPLDSGRCQMEWKDGGQGFLTSATHNVSCRCLGSMTTLPHDCTLPPSHEPTVTQKHTRSFLHSTKIPWAPTQCQAYALP